MPTFNNTVIVSVFLFRASFLLASWVSKEGRKTVSVLGKVKVKGTGILALLGCSREVNQKYRSLHCRTGPHSARRRPELCLVPSAHVSHGQRAIVPRKTSVFKPLGTMPLFDLLCSSWIRSLAVLNLNRNQHLCLLLYSGGSGMFSDGIVMLRWDSKGQWMSHLS